MAAFRPATAGAQASFDVVHRVTPVSPTMPSLMARRCAVAGVPMILGPINGGLPWPAEYPELRGGRARVAVLRARRLPRGAGLRRHPPLRRRDPRRIAGDAAPNPRRLPRQVRLPAGERHRSRTVPGHPSGGDQDAASPGPLRRPPRALQGRATSITAAAPALREGRLRLTVVGDGPERERLEALVAAEGVGGAVSFAGRVPPQEVRHRYGASDLLLFPSVREFGGGVVLKRWRWAWRPWSWTMAGRASSSRPRRGSRCRWRRAGRWSRACGTRWSGRSRTSPRSRRWARPRGAGAESLFTWDAKADQVGEVYAWVAGERAGKPRFGFLPGEA